MKATSSQAGRDLAVAATLAELLERLEHSVAPVGAEQYRSVVLHLVHEFEDVAQGAELGPLLDRFPAAAELYENMHYQHAGLCRSALEPAMTAELRARQAIERARSGRATPPESTV